MKKLIFGLLAAAFVAGGCGQMRCPFGKNRPSEQGQCVRSEKVFAQEIRMGSHSAVTPVSRPEWWIPRHMGVLDQIKSGDVGMILVGDSITHGFDKSGKAVWDKYYAPRKAVNMGFSGDRTQHVLWRLQNGEIACISPKLAMVMIGTNNSKDNTPEEIADGVIAICQKLRNDLPQTKILLLAIFPRTDDPTHPRIQVNADATKIYSQIADNEWIYFMNINEKFVGADGVLRTDLFPDKLHPNAQGYEIWAEAVEPMVKKLMGQ